MRCLWRLALGVLKFVDPTPVPVVLWVAIVVKSGLEADTNL